MHIFTLSLPYSLALMINFFLFIIIFSLPTERGKGPVNTPLHVKLTVEKPHSAYVCPCVCA